MTSRAYVDTETCGLHGMPVLLQYAIDERPIILHEIWRKPIGETLDLIEWLMQHVVVGFNLSFDHFMLVKCYTTFRLCPRDWIPEEHIDEIALKEVEAQQGPCLKPLSALDLLLHSRKGPYQSLMSRGDIRIRRVPDPVGSPRWLKSWKTRLSRLTMHLLRRPSFSTRMHRSGMFLRHPQARVARFTRTFLKGLSC